MSLAYLRDVYRKPFRVGAHVTESEAKHLAKNWDLHFAAGRHAQQAETARANTVNRSAA